MRLESSNASLFVPRPPRSNSEIGGETPEEHQLALGLERADVAGRTLGSGHAALIGVGWRAVTAPTASMAGLPGTRAWVRVGPPLLASVVLRMAPRPSLGTRSVGPGEKPTTPALPLWPKRLKSLAWTVAKES